MYFRGPSGARIFLFLLPMTGCLTLLSRPLRKRMGQKRPADGSSSSGIRMPCNRIIILSNTSSAFRPGPNPFQSRNHPILPRILTCRYASPTPKSPGRSDQSVFALWSLKGPTDERPTDERATTKGARTYSERRIVSRPSPSHTDRKCASKVLLGYRFIPPKLNHITKPRRKRWPTTAP
jgi:hypothetical protein